MLNELGGLHAGYMCTSFYTCSKWPHAKSEKPPPGCIPSLSQHLCLFEFLRVSTSDGDNGEHSQTVSPWRHSWCCTVLFTQKLTFGKEQSPSEEWKKADYKSCLPSHLHTPVQSVKKTRLLDCLLSNKAYCFLQNVFSCKLAALERNLWGAQLENRAEFNFFPLCCVAVMQRPDQRTET